VSRSEYLRLRNHLANSLRMLDSERQRVAELSGLADRFVWKGAKFVPTSVITSYIDAQRGQLVINRGSSDGLRAGQFVMGDDSIIGVISELDTRTARVLLTTDPSAEIAIEFANVDYCGVMRGLGGNCATIPLLPAKYKIEEGDIVYACDKPAFLDNAVVTGIVSQCRRDDKDPLLWNIVVEPACDVDKLEKVIVVITDPQEKGPQV
jgi:rod shape-determining protein MreC